MIRGVRGAGRDGLRGPVCHRAQDVPRLRLQVLVVETALHGGVDRRRAAVSAQAEAVPVEQAQQDQQAEDPDERVAAEGVAAHRHHGSNTCGIHCFPSFLIIFYTYRL